MSVWNSLDHDPKNLEHLNSYFEAGMFILDINTGHSFIILYVLDPYLKSAYICRSLLSLILKPDPALQHIVGAILGPRIR